MFWTEVSSLAALRWEQLSYIHDVEASMWLKKRRVLVQMSITPLKIRYWKRKFSISVNTAWEAPKFTKLMDKWLSKLKFKSAIPCKNGSKFIALDFTHLPFYQLQISFSQSSLHLEHFGNYYAVVMLNFSKHPNFFNFLWIFLAAKATPTSRNVR